jgi:hypothetical protein
MITASEIGDIVFKDCEVFNIHRYRFGNIPEGIVKSERIVVYVKTLIPDDIWNSVFVNVNLCVPDKKGKADLKRLKELERLAYTHLVSSTGSYDGTNYTYRISASSVEEDTALKCHYVNIRLKFDVLNVR